MIYRKIALISDVHLSENDQMMTDDFCSLINTLPKDIEALFILGDLFDQWLGDDMMSGFHLEIAKTLATLSRPCFFLPGNRDFLPNDQWCALANVQRVPETHLIQVGSKKIVLIHGDELCLLDRSYQIYRSIVRKPLVQTLFLSLPQWIRKRIAQNLKRNTHSKREKPASQYAPVDTEITRLIENNNAQILVHGHIHQPGIYPDQNYTRVVLPDWRPNSLKASFICENKIMII